MKKENQKNIDKSTLAEKIVAIFLSFIIILCIIFACTPDDNNKTADNTQKKELTVEQKIKEQFSGWDGSHIKLTKYIKENMNDPKSFEFVSIVKNTFKRNDETVIFVEETFRGKNVFGGVIQNSISAVYDLEGNEIEISEFYY